MIQRNLLIRIEDFARRRWGVVFVVTLLAVAASLLTGRWLRIETDFLAMLPEGEPEIDAFVDTVSDFGSLDFLLVLVEAPEGELAEDLEDVVESFASRLSDLPGIEAVEYRLDETSPAMRLFLDHAVLYLDREGLARLEAALADEAIRERVRRLREALQSPAAPLASGAALRDPLGLAPLFLDGALEERGALRVDMASGYYVSRDGRAMLLVVEPSAPPTDIAFTERLEPEIRQAFREAAADAGRESDEVPRLALGGSYIIALEDARLVRRDLRFNAFVSFFAVTGLYLFCYRRIAAIVYSAGPLVVGQILTFAVAVVVLGGLSSTTTAFTAMLMGLGTDFTIVMYGRYVEERRAGADLPTAMRRMMGETALGVFTGAITSAGTFVAICVSRFPGLREFGFLVGAGILLCMVAILFLLPAMIAWNDGRRSRSAMPVRKLYLHSFGVERLIGVADRHPKTVVAASIVLSIAALLAAGRIELSDSYRDLRSPDNRGFVVQEEVAERFGASFGYMVAVAEGSDVDVALERTEEIVARLEPWAAGGDLAGFDSILDYVPPPARQRAALAALRSGRTDAFSPDRVERTLRRALESEGFRTAPFESAIADLRGSLSVDRPLDVADLEGSALAPLLGRFVRRDEDGVRIATYLFPASDEWRRGVPRAFVEAVRGGDDSIVVTGANVVGPRIREMFRVDAIRAVLLGLLLVALLLLLDFRSLRLTLFGLVQLVVGVLWMLGLMGAAGVRMNLVNAFATTMILGVGIDYGIHLIHRIWSDGGASGAGVHETGKAVVMAALTNIAGFGTIAVSSFPGIRSVGLVCLFGSSTCLLTALTLLPAMMKLLPAPRSAARGITPAA